MATHGDSQPAPAKAESVRGRILRGAMQAFGKHGYGATSVETILSEAGVSRRTFYKEFSGKEEVLALLFQNSVDMLLQAVREADRVGDSKHARLRAAVDAYIRVHAKAGPLARVLLLEQFSPGSPLARQRDAAMLAFAGMISEAFEQAGQRPPDPILIHGVVAGINHIAVQLATEYPSGQWDLERARDSMLRILGALDDAADPKR